MKSKRFWLAVLSTVLVLGMAVVGCSDSGGGGGGYYGSDNNNGYDDGYNYGNNGGYDDGYNYGGNNNGNNGGIGQNYVWRWNKQTIYSVSEGLVGSVSYEIQPYWFRYINDRNFEYEYSYMYFLNNVQTNTSYTSTQTGTVEQTYHVNRYDQTSTSVSSFTYDITTNLVYDNPSLQQYNTTTYNKTESESTSTTIYDSASGLTSRATSSGTSTQTVNNGTPTITPTYSDTSYIIELQSDSGSVRTWKQTHTGTRAYSVFKI
jgi:hypothetical protein